MGEWRILIEGVGPHHGSDPVQHPYDAEKMAARFAQELFSKGHAIRRAEFERLIPPPPDPRVDDLRATLVGTVNEHQSRAMMERLDAAHLSFPDAPLAADAVPEDRE